MPFANEYFDAIVSVDSYHYFGCKKDIFAEKILPYLKKNGYAMIAIPGLKEEPKGELKELFCEWAEGNDSDLFKTAEWFETGHEFALRDKEYLDKRLYDLLNFVLIYSKKK